MTLDQQREKSILALGLLVEGAMILWDKSGCFHARGRADRYRMEMESLIRGRSAAQVLHLEKIRGLAA